jgi:hypothetical protein
VQPSAGLDDHAASNGDPASPPSAG